MCKTHMSAFFPKCLAVQGKGSTWEKGEGKFHVSTYLVINFTLCLIFFKDFHSKSIDWFLYEGNTGTWWVNYYPFSKKGYTLKPFTFVDTLDCNFLGIKNAKISINHNLLCHHNLTFFVGKIYPFLYFWRIDKTSSPILFVGEISIDLSIPLVPLLCYYKWSQ